MRFVSLPKHPSPIWAASPSVGFPHDSQSKFAEMDTAIIISTSGRKARDDAAEYFSHRIEFAS